MKRSETEAVNPAKLPRKETSAAEPELRAETRRPFMSKAGRMVILIGVPVVILSLMFLVYFHDPNLESRYYLPCFFHKITGLYCPGCGDTRALYAMLHLDFPGMMSNNALFPFLIVLLVWVAGGEYLRLLTGKRILWIPKRVSPAVLAIAVLVLAAFTILRNLPFYPFSWLAPGI